MRSLSIAALMAPALLFAAPAVAQVYYQQGNGIPAPPMVSANPPHVGGPVRVGQPRYNQALPPRGGPNRPVYNQPRPNQPGYNSRQNGGRWGGQVNGRWWGGSQAPGGWNSYRRPSRGWSLPGYWMNANFRIHDYGNWGLRSPSYGSYWVRYYDDAVLIDSRGRVQDWRDGISWDDDYAAYDNYGASYGESGSNSYAYSESNVSVGGQGIRQVDPNEYYDQATGYQAQAPYPGGYASSAVGGPPAVQVQPGYGYGNGYGYSSGYSGGGYYAGGTTTTVVIQPAPVVTTTIIEEVIEEEVVTTYVSPRRVVRRAPVRKYKPKPRPVARQCGCQCVCR